MNANPIINEEKYADWDNPYYMAGFHAGCESSDKCIRDDNQKLKDKVDVLKSVNKTLLIRIAGLEQTWYVKLCNKIPRFSLSIRRTN